MASKHDRQNITERQLAKEIRSSQGSHSVVRTTLRTDERVIARVTDGIYRQPGSALRELVSNAYDADATQVVIKTDAPRFERISVEDDGHGMRPEALAHLLLHIGGSAKRSAFGPELGVTSPDDPMLSPRGRKLIGKIGIGLFSVSQLTHSFQIVTKVKGDNYRTVATIAMRQYADSESKSLTSGDDMAEYESGKVNIWREKASDTESHGTTIVLSQIRLQARDTLRSREMWNFVESQREQEVGEVKSEVDAPRYHVGRVDLSGDVMSGPSRANVSLPWDEGDAPSEAFRKLVDAVWSLIGAPSPNPQVDRIFDYYLRMVWQLSLSVPLPYVDGHPFDLVMSKDLPSFMISNLPKGAASEITKQGKSVRSVAKLRDPEESIGEFSVIVDDLKLARPLRFRNLPSTAHAIKTPLVFVGKCREEFASVPRELSGGPLQFEAYLFWAPKIAPVEHQGSLIRIHGSSGTLFDSSFMRYQISEQTRLRQICCEIFISEGLDSALNIDRESFNSAHPHSVFLTKWLHGALRQVASAQKRIASEVRNLQSEEAQDAALSRLQRVATEVWRKESDDPAGSPPAIEISRTGAGKRARGDAYVFPRHEVAPTSTRKSTKRSRRQEAIVEEKVKAIAQVLASYGLLDRLSKTRQQGLMRAIYKIVADEGK